MGTIVGVVTALLCVSESVHGQQRGRDDETASCDETWTFKGLRVGMTLEEAKATHRKVKHRMTDPEGWYTFPIDRMQGVWGAVLTNSAQEIIAYRVGIDDSQTTSTAVIDTLIATLGAPTSERSFQAEPLAYSIYLSNITSTYATIWHDSGCDRLAVFVEDTRLVHGVGGARTEDQDWYLLVVRGETIRELEEQAKEGARDALE